MFVKEKLWPNMRHYLVEKMEFICIIKGLCDKSFGVLSSAQWVPLSWWVALWRIFSLGIKHLRDL